MKNFLTKKLLLLFGGIIIVLLIVIGFFLFPKLSKDTAPKKEVITVSTLEKIIDVSELSTFTAVYNGIAKVMNADKPEEVNYYVSYEAEVDAGIDFKDTKISIDDETKTIHIDISDVYITDVTVDIASLDYIFVNKNANSFSVSQEAFKACEEDVTQESNSQTAILELAAQNAQNILKALIYPLIEQADSEYTLVFD